MKISLRIQQVALSIVVTAATLGGIALVVWFLYSGEDDPTGLKPQMPIGLTGFLISAAVMVVVLVFAIMGLNEILERRHRKARLRAATHAVEPEENAEPEENVAHHPGEVVGGGARNGWVYTPSIPPILPERTTTDTHRSDKT